jgi:hypothetical protein
MDQPNKKPRTEVGMFASAATAPPSAESVGDGKDWKDFDHMPKLKSLTPQVIQKGCRPSLETGFVGYLPKAVIDPPSATMEAEKVIASKGAVTAVKAFFKLAEEADEEERDEDDDSDGYVSSTEGDGFRTTTSTWNNLLTLEAVVDFVEHLPSHLTFTAGFVAVGNEDRNRCYCPCSPRSQQWRKMAGPKAFNAAAGMKFKCKGHYTPAGLLDHLRSHTDPLHHGILSYVKRLYPNLKK